MSSAIKLLNVAKNHHRSGLTIAEIGLAMRQSPSDVRQLLDEFKRVNPFRDRITPEQLATCKRLQADKKSYADIAHAMHFSKTKVYVALKDPVLIKTPKKAKRKITYMNAELIPAHMELAKQVKVMHDCGVTLSEICESLDISSTKYYMLLRDIVSPPRARKNYATLPLKHESIDIINGKPKPKRHKLAEEMSPYAIVAVLESLYPREVLDRVKEAL